jgi:hypothetical protein
MRRGTLEKLLAKLGSFLIFGGSDDVCVNLLQVAPESGLRAARFRAHRNDVTDFAALRPNQDDKTAAEVTRSDHACLGIVESPVLIIEGDPGENLGGVLEIEAAVRQGRFPLFDVEANLHRHYSPRSLGSPY